MFLSPLLRRTTTYTHHRRLPHALSRRAASSSSSNKSPWLSDKSLYPLLAICGTTVVVGLWFGPYWLYRAPESKINPLRRHDSISKKEPHEGLPLNENLYKKSQEMTKDIYRVTVKDEEGSKGE